MARLRARLPLLVGKEHKRQRSTVNKALYALEHSDAFLAASAFQTRQRRQLAADAIAHDAGTKSHDEDDKATSAPSARAVEVARLHFRSVVTSCYDDFAPHYEATLRRLGYGTPGKMVAALLAAVVSDTQQEGTQASGDPQVVLSSRLAMDVGCGTGLSGAAVYRHCRGRLVGCDLSTRMLGVAATKRREAACGDDKGGLLYGALDCCDAAAFLLRAAASSADLIVACEVLCYCHELDGLFAAVRRCLAPRGLFAFSVELATAGEVECPPQGPGWIERPSERMAHSEAYVRQLIAGGRSPEAADAAPAGDADDAVEGGGLELLSIAEETLRTDEGAPIRGLIVVVRKR